jgi:O-antigen/teichoic acid export membrane protein/thymidylate kinase
MSTITAALDAPEQVRSKDAPASTLRWLGRSSWGLADQVLISGTNFATMVFTARALRPDSAAFGEFSLVYSALLFANIFQSTLITDPHNVLGASRRGDDYRRYTGATAVSQAVLCAAMALGAVLLALLSYLRHWEMAPLLMALGPAIIAWQFQEFFRRVLYTEGRLAAAFANDLLSYGGQTALVLILWQTHRLTGPSALHALAITSVAAAAWGTWQVRRSLWHHPALAVLRENWHFGKWLAGAGVLAWFSSLHIYLYISAVILGPVASGELKAAQIMFGPTRIFSFFLGTVLPIRFARTHAEGGNAALSAQFKATFVSILPWLGIYCLFIGLFGQPLLHLLYGSAFAGGASVLALYSLASFLNYVAMFLSATLLATRRTQTIFAGYVWGAIIALFASWPVIAALGVNGAVICMILTSVAVNYLFFRVYMTRIARGEEQTRIVADSRQEQLGSGPMLLALLDLLERNQIPWCLLHGYQDYPDQITSDVDCLIPSWAAPQGFRRFLQLIQRQLGAGIVQCIDDRAQFIVLRSEQPLARAPAPPAWLQFHAIPNFEIAHCLFYRSDEIIASRRRHNGFWVPAVGIEFACTLLNRINKGALADKHRRTLASLYARDPLACRAELSRFWPAHHVKTIVAHVEASQWDALRALAPVLRRSMILRAALHQGPRILRSLISSTSRRIGRWLHPRFGLHVVFLGPDGVGKSAVIDAVQKDIAPAFLRSSYATFAPALLPKQKQQTLGPHDLPPRSLPASLIKAGWWFYCYNILYWFNIYPTRARAGVVINHRYLLDALVDPRRYRYSGPMGLLKFIWMVAPKPDLVILLDAPPQVIQARKKEVSFTETARQRDEYLSLAATLPNAHIIDAAQDLPSVVADVNRIIIGFLAARTQRQGGWR